MRTPKTGLNWWSALPPNALAAVPAKPAHWGAVRSTACRSLFTGDLARVLQTYVRNRLQAGSYNRSP